MLNYNPKIGNSRNAKVLVHHTSSLKNRNHQLILVETSLIDFISILQQDINLRNIMDNPRKCDHFLISSRILWCVLTCWAGTLKVPLLQVHLALGSSAALDGDVSNGKFFPWLNITNGMEYCHLGCFVVGMVDIWNA